MGNARPGPQAATAMLLPFGHPQRHSFYFARKTSIQLRLVKQGLIKLAAFGRRNAEWRMGPTPTSNRIVLDGKAAAEWTCGAEGPVTLASQGQGSAVCGACSLGLDGLVLPTTPLIARWNPLHDIPAH